MTITQTVEIPADRRITLEVPHEVPIGAIARLEIVWPLQNEAAPLPGSTAHTVEEALQIAAEKVADPNRKPITHYFGTLSKHTFGDPAAYQKAIRDEWE